MLKHTTTFALLLAATLPLHAQSTQPTDILLTQMQSLYDEVKTPYKYGVVLEPPPGQKIDCPAVFRKDNHWYMLYVHLENKPTQGYTTQLATSDDLLHWKPLGTILDRGPDNAWDHANVGTGPALTNEPPPTYNHGVISGDPQIVRIHNTWVMFYFGAFWKPGAFNTFAASTDLQHWTKWTGDNLVQPSEPYDTPFAHKSWVLKSDGIVYHFYCAVGGKDQHRTIALATSKDLKSK